jgi:hypothetical protein
MSNEKPTKDQPQAQEVQLQLELDEATAQGAYTNLALISHSATEFVMDFIFIQPQQPRAKVRARVISSPGHTKRFLKALAENVNRYEQVFGEIKEIGPAPDAHQIKLH